MPVLLICQIWFCFVCCNETKSGNTDLTLSGNEDLQVHKTEIEQQYNVNDSITNDSLIFDSISINRLIPLKLSAKFLTASLGRPDSIIKEDDWECGNYLNDKTTVSIYYYGKSRFIVSDGEALLQVLDLKDKRLSFVTSSMELSQPISEVEVSQLFPGSYARMKQGMATDKHYGPKRLIVEMKNQPLWQDGCGFIFNFDNDQLTSIELWWFIC